LNYGADDEQDPTENRLLTSSFLLSASKDGNSRTRSRAGLSTSKPRPEEKTSARAQINQDLPQGSFHRENDEDIKEDRCSPYKEKRVSIAQDRQDSSSSDEFVKPEIYKKKKP
jgi:hypothetical protein